MKYSKEQWAKCRWNLEEIPEGANSFDHYPELLDIFKPIFQAYVNNPPQDSEAITFDLLVRYVVLVYHRYSPYAVNEQNIIKRKMDVCEALNLGIEKEYTKKIIANKNRFVNSSAIHFLKQEGSIDWFELQQYLEAYYQIMAALTDDTADTGSKTLQDVAKVKLGIVKEMKQIKFEIDTLSSKVFGGDNDLLNHVERYKKEEAESFQILSPEDFVRSKRVAEA